MPFILMCVSYFRLIKRYVGIILALLALFVLQGCIYVPGMPVFDAKFNPRPSPSSVPGKDFKLVSLNSQNVTRIPKVRTIPAPSAARASGTGGYKYRVGARDILTITVWDHPELTIPAGEFRSPTAAGNKVGEDGYFFFPYAGRIRAAGRTTEQIRVELQNKLEKFITNPQVGVRVADYRSQRAFISGMVIKPGVYQINDIPLTVRDAIGRAGGLRSVGTDTNKEAAEWALLTRANKKRIVIDLGALLRKGDNRYNYVMRNGDALYIPDRDRTEKIFVMGEVKSPRTITLNRFRVSLSDALSGAGGINENSANPSGIFVVRKEKPMDRKPTVYQLNLRSVDSLLLAEQFTMRKRDIVYVTAAPITRWNRVISQLIQPNLDSATSIDNLAK